MDDSRLSLKLCEQSQEQEELNVINSPCCACQEAKYEVMFQGLWNKGTHPKDFPSSEWLLHFSDLIGASHSEDYRFASEYKIHSLINYPKSVGGRGLCKQGTQPGCKMGVTSSSRE